MNDKVSVIVPIYNVEKYVAFCLESIMKQTYKNLEILIIDDGSPDHSSAICEKIAQSDFRIKVLHKKNGGAASARNYGMKYATGQYFVFVDSDDWIENTMIEDLLNAAKENDVKIACCGHYRVKENKIKKEIHIQDNCLFSFREIIEKTVFDDGVGTADWAKIYDRSVFDKIEFPEGEINEDAAIIYRLFAKCEKIYVLGKSYYYYRQNSDGVTKQDYSEKYDVVLKNHLSNIEFVSAIHPDARAIMEASAACSYINMIRKIIRMADGCTKYSKQLNVYQSYLKVYKSNYIQYKKPTVKELVWLFITLHTSDTWIKLYKLAGII